MNDHSVPLHSLPGAHALPADELTRMSEKRYNTFRKGANPFTPCALGSEELPAGGASVLRGPEDSNLGVFRSYN